MLLLDHSKILEENLPDLNGHIYGVDYEKPERI